MVLSALVTTFYRLKLANGLTCQCSRLHIFSASLSVVGQLENKRGQMICFDIICGLCVCVCLCVASPKDSEIYQIGVASFANVTIVSGTVYLQL